MPPEFAFISMSFPPLAKAGRSVVRRALFPITRLLLTVSASALPPSKPTKTPPPSAKRPFGAAAAARFRDTTVPDMVRLPWALKMPPPSESLATGGSPATGPTLFPLTSVCTNVSFPQLSMPPPAAMANGH